ncbi:hypothetical protein QUA03_19335 [Microcoleus sp. S36b_A4]|uniref:hypothetical protein n=1 Tax=Microcoleus sp. S36b_A4 TaxID=3055420 RepID=UPI002FCF84AA
MWQPTVIYCKISDKNSDFGSYASTAWDSRSRCTKARSIGDQQLAGQRGRSSQSISLRIYRCGSLSSI